MNTATQAVTFRVHQVSPLGPDVYRVGLAASHANSLRFEAGQYLKLILPDGALKAFSIASAPESSLLELQVQAPPVGHGTPRLIEHFRQCDTVTCQLPFGRCRLPPDPTPVLMIAGGTGIAPMRAMLASSVARGERRDIWLYWGVGTPESLYLDAELSALSAAHPRVRYRPVLAQSHARWGGAVGLPHELALAEHACLSGVAVHCSGSAAMARAVYRAFRTRGLPAERFHCDWIDLMRTLRVGDRSVT